MYQCDLPNNCVTKIACIALGSHALVFTSLHVSLCFIHNSFPVSDHSNSLGLSAVSSPLTSCLLHNSEAKKCILFIRLLLLNCFPVKIISVAKVLTSSFFCVENKLPI
ncbi:hypothetical protein AMECASPLE_025343 [Ameca splendens]|uniref:Uncharacterized protein n=1 Tax=Ameca splendens TaxID=208324 RepID=A0ABV0ZQN5_9TELE